MNRPIPFIVIVDTREQFPYLFEDYLDAQVTTRKLDTGDYSIEGFENIITIERKEQGDFINSITNDRTRFEAEIIRMIPFRYKFIVVENKLENIEKQVKERGTVNWRSVSGTIASWSVKYDVHFQFLLGRLNCQDFIYQIFKSFMRLKNGNYNG